MKGGFETGNANANTLLRVLLAQVNCYREPYRDEMLAGASWVPLLPFRWLRAQTGLDQLSLWSAFLYLNDRDYIDVEFRQVGQDGGQYLRAPRSERGVSCRMCCKAVQEAA